MTDKSVNVDIQEYTAADSTSNLFIKRFRADNPEFYGTVDTTKELDKSTEPQPVIDHKNSTIDIPVGNRKKSVSDFSDYVKYIISKAQEYYPPEFTDTASECGRYMKKQKPYPYYLYGKEIIVFDIKHRYFRKMDMEKAIYTLESYYGIEVGSSFKAQLLAKRIINEICLQSETVEYFGNIAGYSGGVYEALGGEWVIVSRTVPILEAAPLIPHEVGTPLYWDKWKPLYDYIFYPMFVCGKDKRQLDYVFKWLAAARAYVSGRTSLKVPCLQICGDVCTGKTLLGAICNALLTGQKKDPSLYLYGQKQYNSQLIEATLLLMDDKNESTRKDINKIKEMLVGDGLQVNTKYVAEEPVLYPRQVMMILANKDVHSRNGLIPICSDTIDKVSLLETMGRIPEMEREVRWKMIEDALRYFAAYLDYEVYPTLSQKGRMIVPAWQYSKAVEMVFKDTKEGQLWHHLTLMLKFLDDNGISLYGKPMIAGEWVHYLTHYKELKANLKYDIPSKEQIGKMFKKLAKMDELKGCIEVGKRITKGTPYTIHKIAKMKE